MKAFLKVCPEVHRAGKGKAGYVLLNQNLTTRGQDNHKFLGTCGREV